MPFLDVPYKHASDENIQVPPLEWEIRSVGYLSATCPKHEGKHFFGEKVNTNNDDNDNAATQRSCERMSGDKHVQTASMARENTQRVKVHTSSVHLLPQRSYFTDILQRSCNTSPPCTVRSLSDGPDTTFPVSCRLSPTLFHAFIILFFFPPNAAKSNHS